MIRLIKPTEPPEILKKNAPAWTQELIDAINRNGSYNKIPSDEKRKLLSHFKNKTIGEALMQTSHGKCAFCECTPGESGYPEVEHFLPKSKYPEKSYEWDNLLPSCKKCNLAKSDTDTVAKPIVNPYVEDPEEYFRYEGLVLAPLESTYNKEKAQDTIDILMLNGTRLLNPRGDLLKQLSKYACSIDDQIRHISQITDIQRKKRKVLQLDDSLTVVEELAKPNYNFAGFVQSFIRTNTSIQKAKRLVQETLAGEGE